MKLVSVNVGLPKIVEINGQSVNTGIYKTPVTSPVLASKLGLAGDGQADLTVHGGEHQALYSYPVEHYAYWAKILGGKSLDYGMFGENLTVVGMLEDEVYIGDILQIGEVGIGPTVQITMPRIPCFKFGHKIGQPSILDTFLRSGRSGFYQRVLTAGHVQAGDALTITQRDPQQITVRVALGLQKLQEGDAALLQKALQVESLAPLLRSVYQQRLSASE